MATPSSPTTTLTLPQPDPFNLQAVKRYVFNETGNIMLSNTDSPSHTIPQSVRDVFAEVAVFLQLLPTISQRINPPGMKDATGNCYWY